MNRLDHLFRATSLLVASCVLATTMPAVAQGPLLTCSSNDGAYHYCRADTQNRVQLTRQISGSPCQQGYSWGYDYRGIWVDRGCRAQFEYGFGNGNSNNGGDGSNTSAAIAAGILGAIVVGSIIASQTAITLTTTTATISNAEMPTATATVAVSVIGTTTSAPTTKDIAVAIRRNFKMILPQVTMTATTTGPTGTANS